MKKNFFSFMCKNGSLSHFALLFFRVAVAFELLIAHGLKKIGIGVAIAETVPNPLGLPEFFNQAFANSGQHHYAAVCCNGIIYQNSHFAHFSHYFNRIFRGALS